MATVASTILDPTLQNADAIEFETSLNRKVVGQPEAAHKVTTALQSFMAGWNDPPGRSLRFFCWALRVRARPGLFVL